MTVFATEGQYSRFSSLVKASDTPERFDFHTDLVTANEAATPTYKLGTVLGKVTATGKYKIAVETAVDGSKVAAAIVLGNSFGAIEPQVLVAATDTKFVALTRGKVIVSKEALTLDATYDNQAKKDAVYASLNALGILVEASN